MKITNMSRLEIKIFDNLRNQRDLLDQLLALKNEERELKKLL